MKKLESLMEENRRWTSNLEKENKNLEDKLTSVNISIWFIPISYIFFARNVLNSTFLFLNKL